MHLLDSELKNGVQWGATGIQLPEFNREAMKAAARECPQWIHFGAGNVFRVFPAALQQKLLNKGVEETGVIVAEGYDYRIIKKTYRPQSGLNLLVTLKASRIIEKTVIGSLAESLTVDRQDEADWSRLRNIFASPILRMVSFTITEKGYSITTADGSFRQDVLFNFEADPNKADSYIGKLVSLCHWRYTHGGAPLALVNMDNCPHNDDKPLAAADAYAKVWDEKGLAVEGFLVYIESLTKVPLPWSMIGEVTPRPGDSVKRTLEETGFTDTESTITNKNTYVIPFVNAEEAEYLMIEDVFPNGRPVLEQAGVMFTTRDTIKKVEHTKVCTCLNPLYTTLAVYGCLLGYTKINGEMKDEDLVELVKIIGYKEGLLVVASSDTLSSEEFIDEVLIIRAPNPFMPDTPQRIVRDASQKLSVRFGETVREYMVGPELDVESLKFIPMVQAGWYRYLLNVDDEGDAFTVSPDPMYEGLASKPSSVRIGEAYDVYMVLQPALSDAKIPGVDLYETGLGEYVKSIFTELTAGKGTVRVALRKHLAEVRQIIRQRMSRRTTHRRVQEEILADRSDDHFPPGFLVSYFYREWEKLIET